MEKNVLMKKIEQLIDDWESSDRREALMDLLWRLPFDNIVEWAIRQGIEIGDARESGFKEVVLWFEENCTVGIHGARMAASMGPRSIIHEMFMDVELDVEMTVAGIESVVDLIENRMFPNLEANVEYSYKVESGVIDYVDIYVYPDGEGWGGVREICFNVECGGVSAAVQYR